MLTIYLPLCQIYLLHAPSGKRRVAASVVAHATGLVTGPLSSHHVCDEEGYIPACRHRALASLGVILFMLNLAQRSNLVPAFA